MRAKRTPVYKPIKTWVVGEQNTLKEARKLLKEYHLALSCPTTVPETRHMIMHDVRKIQLWIAYHQGTKNLERPASVDTLTFDVTQDDIHNGERGDCGGCPVALAILRAVSVASQALSSDQPPWLHDVNYVSVTTPSILICFKNPDQHPGIFADNPRELRNFIDRFDRKDECKPQTFTITFTPNPTNPPRTNNPPLHDNQGHQVCRP